MKLKPVWEDNVEEWGLETGGSLWVFPDQKRNEWGVEKTNSLGIVEGKPSYFPTKKDAVKFAKEWYEREDKMIHLEIQVEKAEWFTPHRMYGTRQEKSRKALELRIRINDVMYAAIRYTKEQALESILNDIRKNTGMDLSQVLPKLFSDC